MLLHRRLERGLFSAYKAGLGEQIAMRIVDGVASIPLLIWAIAIVGILGVGPVRVGPCCCPNEGKIDPAGRVSVLARSSRASPMRRRSASSAPTMYSAPSQGACALGRS